MKKFKNEFEFVFETYRRYRFEIDGRWPRLSFTNYELAEEWLKDQGCYVNIFGKEDQIPQWENENKKVEFYLRWT